MTEQREQLQAWLDEASPTEAERAEDAEHIWSGRRRVPYGALGVAVAASIALGLWWVRPDPEPTPKPEFASRLEVSVQGDEVRIHVGVRRTP